MPALVLSLAKAGTAAHWEGRKQTPLLVILCLSAAQAHSSLIIVEFRQLKITGG